MRAVRGSPKQFAALTELLKKDLFSGHISKSVIMTQVQCSYAASFQEACKCCEYTALLLSCEAADCSTTGTQKSDTQLQYVDVQMQSGANDCGLFAIAFATALCHGELPGKYIFERRAMRGHLMKCLEAVNVPSS